MAKPKTDGIKVKFGKGVMDKWGKEPFAARTMHAVRTDGFMIPIDYSMKNIGLFLMNEEYAELQIIDEDNVQVTITK